MQKLAKYASQLGSATLSDIKGQQNKYNNNIYKEMNTNIYPNCEYTQFKQQKEQNLIEKGKEWILDEEKPQE